MKASNLSEREVIIGVLSERLEAHDKSRRDAQEKLEEICKGLEASVNELETELEVSLRISPQQRTTASRAHSMPSRWTMMALRRLFREQKRSSL